MLYYSKPIFLLLQIDVDEKFFFLKREQTRTRSRDSDPRLPSKSVIHKSHIPQIMFIAAVGVPQHSPDRLQYSDGKIGIFPFVQYSAAVKSSVNRPKGALVLRDVSVTAETFYEMMTKKGGVFDAIRAVPYSILLSICLSNAQVLTTAHDVSLLLLLLLSFRKCPGGRGGLLSTYI